MIQGSRVAFGALVRNSVQGLVFWRPSQNESLDTIEAPLSAWEYPVFICKRLKLARRWVKEDANPVFVLVVSPSGPLQ